MESLSKARTSWESKGNYKALQCHPLDSHDLSRANWANFCTGSLTFSKKTFFLVRAYTFTINNSIKLFVFFLVTSTVSEVTTKSPKSSESSSFGHLGRILFEGKGAGPFHPFSKSRCLHRKTESPHRRRARALGRLGTFVDELTGCHVGIDEFFRLPEKFAIAKEL